MMTQTVSSGSMAPSDLNAVSRKTGSAFAANESPIKVQKPLQSISHVIANGTDRMMKGLGFELIGTV